MDIAELSSVGISVTLIVVLAVLLVSFLLGAKEGLVKTFYRLFSGILVMVLSVALTPGLAGIIRSNEKIYGAIESNIEGVIGRALDEMIEKNAEQTEEKEETDEKSEEEKLSSLLKKAGENGGISLPESFLGNFSEVAENAGVKLEDLAGGAMADATAAIREQADAAKAKLAAALAEQVTDYLIRIASFVVLFLVLSVLLFVLAHALDIIAKLPVLNSMNRVAGGLCGLLGGLLIVWIAFMAVTIFIKHDFAQQILRDIEGNVFLKMLYDYNPIMKVVSSLKG